MRTFLTILVLTLITFSKSCNQFCKQCINDVCHSCDDGYGLTKTNFCASCETGCQSCKSTDFKNCTSCLPGYSLLSDNTCLKNECDSGCLQCTKDACLICENGYELNEKNICLLCDSNCLKCSSPDVDTCLSCKKGYNLTEFGQCEEYRCPYEEQFYDENSDSCLLCDTSCKTCFSASNEGCNYCSKYYYFRSIDGHQTCLYCGNKENEHFFKVDQATEACAEVCGDGRKFTQSEWGFNFAVNECDDGNQIDGDCCSSDCKIEYDCACTTETENSPDICSRIPITPDINIEELSDHETEIRLLFSQKIIYDGSIESHIKVFILNITTENSFEFKIIQKNFQEISITITVYVELDEPTLYLEITDLASDTGKPVESKINVTLPSYPPFSKIELVIMSVLGRIGSALASVGLIATLLGGGGGAALPILITLQQLVYILFCNITIPPNAYEFMGKFAIYQLFSLIPNPLQKIYQYFPFLAPNYEEDIKTMIVPLHIAQKGYFPLWWDNLTSGGEVALLTIILAYLTQFILSRKRMKEKNNCLKKVLLFLHHQLKWSLLFWNIEFNFMDTVLCSIMQIYFFRPLNILFIINMVFGYIGIVYCFFFLVLMLRATNQKDEKVFNEKWQLLYGGLVNGFKRKHFLTRNFKFINYLKNASWSTILFCLYYYPITQTSCLFTSQILFVFYIILCRPAVNRRENIKNIITESLLAILILCFTILAINDKIQFMSKTASKNYFGYLIIVLVTFFVGLNVFAYFNDGVSYLWKLIKSCYIGVKKLKKLQKKKDAKSTPRKTEVKNSSQKTDGKKSPTKKAITNQPSQLSGLNNKNRRDSSKIFSYTYIELDGQKTPQSETTNIEIDIQTLAQHNALQWIMKILKFTNVTFQQLQNQLNISSTRNKIN